jgi:uncharacterized protein (DUF362 family)
MCRINFQENPFRRTPGKTEVFVTAGDGPYKNTRNALKNIDLSPARNKRVLLKPNAGRLARPGEGATTDPQVMAAAIDAFQEAGSEVAIGESPIAGVKALEAFERCGIAEVASKRHCPLIDMDSRPGIAMKVPGGLAIHRLVICADLLEFDLVVSIPVMKTHMHTGVTLSVKNMKGCLWGRSKAKLHMLPPVAGYDEKPINLAISDMASIIRPHLSIIDGTVGMQGLGPSAGEAKKVGVIAAGEDAFAADAIACRLMGMNAAEIPHLAIGADRGFGTIDLKEIIVKPDNWENHIVVFDPPPRNLAISFPDVKILDENSCSACQSTLLLLLKDHGKQVVDYFPENMLLHIAIGKGHAGVPLNTLCIGNCTSRHRNRGIFIKGCPPVASEILDALAREPLLNTLK